MPATKRLTVMIGISKRVPFLSSSRDARVEEANRIR